MPARFYPLKGQMTIAVIDPTLALGENGQYQKFVGDDEEVLGIAALAKEARKEVRLYYQDLQAAGDELVASKIIETWIPPFHVQPFHTHHTLHEMTVVVEGAILAIDSDLLNERDLKRVIGTQELFKLGTIVHKHAMVIEGPGTRHTVVNHTAFYAVMITIQTARMGMDKFPSDWQRDKPAA